MFLMLLFFGFFKPPTRNFKSAGGIIMFSGPYGNLVTAKSQELLGGLSSNLAHFRVHHDKYIDELIRFWPISAQG